MIEKSEAKKKPHIEETTISPATVTMVKSRAQVGNSGPIELEVLPQNVQQHIEAGWKIKG